MKFIILILVIVGSNICGCVTVPPKINPLKKLMIEECAEERKSNKFNSMKSYQLIFYECQQIMNANSDFKNIDNNFIGLSIKNDHNKEDEEDFDSETWFLITEVIRKNYYPFYLEPEKEVARSKIIIKHQENKDIEKSLVRSWEPRLLPVSPYLMNYNQLVMALEAIDFLIDKKELDGYKIRFLVIKRIITNEMWKK